MYKNLIYVGFVVGTLFFLIGLFILIAPSEKLKESAIPPVAMGGFFVLYGAYRFFVAYSRYKKLPKDNENDGGA